MGNALVPLLRGRLVARLQFEDYLPQVPAAAALTASVPRPPAFAADLAQHAADGGQDLIR